MTEENPLTDIYQKAYTDGGGYLQLSSPFLAMQNELSSPVQRLKEGDTIQQSYAERHIDSRGRVRTNYYIPKAGSYPAHRVIKRFLDEDPRRMDYKQNDVSESSVMQFERHKPMDAETGWARTKKVTDNEKRG